MNLFKTLCRKFKNTNTKRISTRADKDAKTTNIKTKIT